MNGDEAVWIVIAWAEPVLVAESPDTVRIDLGERPVTATVLRRHAVVWRCGGFGEDVARAIRHAATLDHSPQVFTYPLTERAPLVRARADLEVLDDQR